jgi:S1-C subfamily serine protease
MDDPSFREFFGDRFPQQQTPRRVEGVGSGVIVSPDGYILTNHHVVDGALEIKVELTDNRTFTAKLIGSDPPSDLAVLKIEDGKALPTLSLGDSRESAGNRTNRNLRHRERKRQDNRFERWKF